MKIIGVIPARYAATRFEGKVLAPIQGKPMIQHVWERAKKSRLLEEVFIACDDERVFDAAQDFGAKVVMTSPEYQSGTERIAQSFRHSPAEIIVNIQGDEPLIQAPVIDALAQAMLNDKSCAIATTIKLIINDQDLNNPNVVKIVKDGKQNAVYFSRAPIPFVRDAKGFQHGVYYKHFGLYAYRKDFLKNFKNLPVSELERLEKLEQLRFLEGGYKIKTIETDYESIGVDTPEDLKRVESFLNAGSEHVENNSAG